MVVADADVLGHFHSRDYIERFGRVLKVEEILELDLHVLVPEFLRHALCVLLLIRGHHHAGDICALAGEVVS